MMLIVFWREPKKTYRGLHVRIKPSRVLVKNVDL